MQTLLDFLKAVLPSYSDAPASFSREALNKEKLEKLNRTFGQQHFTTPAVQSHLRTIHPIVKDQIWLVRRSYIDFTGIEQKTDHPLIVRIISEVEEFAEEQFVRVQVVSPFIEFKASDDLVCGNAAVVGFPFLVETWNEQPMLTELLDQYMGNYESPTVTETGEGTLTREQRDFRTIEVNRAKYLNRSIASLLYYLENRQAADAGVVVSMGGEVRFPVYHMGTSPASTQLLLAAKSGGGQEDKYLNLKEAQLPFEIQVRKNETGYVLTIIPGANIQLLDANKKAVRGIVESDRIVFSELKQGLYQLIKEDDKDPINIRLK